MKNRFDQKKKKMAAKKVVVICLLSSVVCTVAAFFAGTVFAVQLALAPSWNGYVDRSPCRIITPGGMQDECNVNDHYLCYTCRLQTGDGTNLSVCLTLPTAFQFCQPGLVLNCALDSSVPVRAVILEGSFTELQAKQRATADRTRTAAIICFCVALAPLSVIAFSLLLLWRGSAAQRARRWDRAVKLQVERRMAAKMLLLAAVLKEQPDDCAISSLNVHVMRRIIELL